MSDNSSSNKRIARNTLLLYARMLFSMLISLYTSRVILAALGIEDYGLYNVVGSIVTMFTFLNAAMGNASGRYITFALGKGDEKELKEVVSTSCMIHWIVAGIILLLAETVGLWFLHNKLIIPEGRMAACEWVYQFSVIASMITIISVPYNSMVIAHEKMGAFAYISILIVTLKLVIAFLIQRVHSDRLVFYAFCILFTVLLERLIYQIYCWRNFSESRHIKLKKYPQFKEMLSFAGWKLFGNLMVIANTQGVNILLNMFFGPVINAARGIAAQVESAVNGFVVNFQLAVRPQITKSYAVGDINRVQDLIILSSKLSFFLLLFFIVPIFIEANKILALWLVEVPEHTASFLRLVLLVLVISPLENPIGIAKDSTGNIKKYSVISSCLQGLIIVIDYVALKMGAEPEAVFVIQFIMLGITLFAKFSLTRKDINISFRQYMFKLVLRLVLVTIIASILPFLLFYYTGDSTISFLMVCIVALFSVLGSSYFVGLNSQERHVVNEMVIKFLHKK